MLLLTPVVKQLLLLNSGLFLAQKLLGIDLIAYLGLRSFASQAFYPYQFLTHLFLHHNTAHLVTNMLSLSLFGPVLENTLTSKRFFILYLLTGLGAATLYSGIHTITLNKLKIAYHAYLACPDITHFVAYLHQCPPQISHTFTTFIEAFAAHPQDIVYLEKGKSMLQQLYQLHVDIPLLGASGAIFGLLTAFALLFPNTELFIFFLPIPIKAKYVMIGYGLYEFYLGAQNNPADNVAHFAHLGGILFAYLFIKWERR